MEQQTAKRVASQSLEKEIKEIEITKTTSIKFKLPQQSGNFINYDKSQQKSLDRIYFRKEVVELAQDLLGKVIVHQTQCGVLRAIIVETQAYKAPLDKGCHAYNNKKTQRTKYFWLDGGHLYAYTIYMPSNVCINVVAGLQNEPQAVLIRAVQPIDGIDIMREKRKIKSNKIQDLSNGPGKVGMCLSIDKDTMNGRDLTTGSLRIVDAGIKDFKMGISKRINIDYAEEWIDKPWRFYVIGNSFVSKVNPDAPSKKKK